MQASPHTQSLSTPVPNSGLLLYLSLSLWVSVCISVVSVPLGVCTGFLVLCPPLLCLLVCTPLRLVSLYLSSLLRRHCVYLYLCLCLCLCISTCLGFCVLFLSLSPSECLISPSPSYTSLSFSLPLPFPPPPFLSAICLCSCRLYLSSCI